MGGDLNLKKSWHPSLLRNQERVWSEEKRALEERKKVEQLRRERDEERQIQELQRLQEGSGKPRQHNRVDWMYQAPSSATGHYSEEMEGYLLGKRRIDGILLKNDESKKLEKGADLVGANAAQQPVAGRGNPRDMMAKVMADPLMEIRKREQAAYENAVKEAAARRKFVAREERERERGHRRRDGEEDSRRHHRRSHRRRSRSPAELDRSSHRRRRDERDGRDRKDRERRDRDDRDYRSNRRGDRDERDDRASRRGSLHDRSPSPRPDYRHSDRRRTDDRSNGYSRDHDRRDRSYHHNDRDRRDNWGPRDSYGRDRPSDAGAGAANRAKELEEERKRKLEEMQSNANDIEETRRQRIADVTAMEEKQREEDEKQRSERGRFVSGLHRQLQEDNLDDRIKRSRGGLARMED
ncbi:U2-type spliceosomal complex subunit CWC25 [Aspergillus alliaceus]|uniref:U2-type spliceosomal complex subunit CWC25 n=1 Tax=Petromyces alliaceus TaxID=209559 RepID=UPI0012A6C53F|nr:Pre-mRNA splicing factor-domain-containing protein [Aspergillus alliaceus]KAB8233345.1 Pre-mRNA splicing factor-domain-containing protein [Aspergillus alliaceus]